jgi:hypothetical protein
MVTVPDNVVASAFQAKIPASKRRTAAVIPTDNLRILNPPIMLEERGSVNQKRGLIGTLGATGGLEERLPEQ